MAEPLEDNNIPLIEEPIKDPKPLALEGAEVQMELDVKPKPQDKITNVKYGNKNLIKDMINVPKVGQGEQPQANTTSASQAPPKEDIKAVQQRLAEEQKTYEGEAPTMDECQDTAALFVDIIDFALTFLAQKFALDEDDKPYKVDADKKNKLKKHLATYLARMNKKYPIEFILILTVVTCYAPAFMKAYNHRKTVQEERAKKKATVIASDPPSGKKRRRKSDDDSENGSSDNDNIPLTPVEVL